MLMRYMGMQQKKSSATPAGGNQTPPAPPSPSKPRRIPPPFSGIQYNVCKNPACPQYGVEPPEHARKAVKGPYAVAASGKGQPVLKCNACGQMPPMKSNRGIFEEYQRLSAYLSPRRHFCPAPDCPNHHVPVGTPKAYRSYGKNSQGSKRMQCAACGKTFAIAKPTKGQHATHKNRDIFSMLVNKVALSRIVKMTGVSWEVLYNRIDFIHDRCMAFAAHREAKLRTKNIRRLYLAVDRQDYLVNWTERSDKRNVVLKSIACADNETGYVFCSALNFDDGVDRAAVEAEAARLGDAALPAPHRHHARFWTSADYAASVARSNAGKRMPAGSLQSAISNAYASAGLRDDVEVFDEKTNEEALPSMGMQVHSEYTMIAMFLHLRKMVGACEGWRFFMDQESGIRSACLWAFRDEIAARRAEAFYIRIEKEMVQEEKRKRMADAKKLFDQTRQANPGLTDNEVRLAMIKAEIANNRAMGQFGDRWVALPLPSMSEPSKAVCWLTEHADFRKPDGTPDDDHVAWLYNKASLHAVDTYFMKTRRSMMMCERPITSSSNVGRIWSAYQSYNPAVLKKLLEIFRVHHNYTDLPMQGKIAEKKTPAMRLGLADAPLDLNDILYYTD
jgi:transposase-like protein